MAKNSKTEHNTDSSLKSKPSEHSRKAKKRKYFETTKTVQTVVVTKAAQTTSARIPTKVEEASSNWKSLMSSIKPVNAPKGKRPEARRQVEASTSNVTPVNTTRQVVQKTVQKEVWFDNVDPILLESLQVSSAVAGNFSLVKDGGFKGVTKTVAIDCEMVGVGIDGVDSALARVSVVNHFGHCIYDKYVLPGEEVTDYRTHVSGIRPHNLKDALDLAVVRQEVSDILRGKVLVGHALRNDLQALLIKHPKSKIRDTSKFKMFRSLVNGATPSLKLLAGRLLGVNIQSGEHSSIQDAQAAMRLYTMFRQKWEAELTSLRRERLEQLKKAREEKESKKKSAT